MRVLEHASRAIARPIPERLTPARAAIVAFSRFEIDVHELRSTLRAAGWSHDQVETLVASARRNLRRVSL